MNLKRLVVSGDCVSGVLLALEDVQELNSVQEAPVREISDKIINQDGVLKLKPNCLHRIVNDSDLIKVSSQNIEIFHIVALCNTLFSFKNVPFTHFPPDGNDKTP